MARVIEFDTMTKIQVVSKILWVMMVIAKFLT